MYTNTHTHTHTYIRELLHTFRTTGLPPDIHPCCAHLWMIRWESGTVRRIRGIGVLFNQGFDPENTGCSSFLCVSFSVIYPLAPYYNESEQNSICVAPSIEK